MRERDLDGEQHRLLTALEDIEMSSELREQLEAVVRQWIEKQRLVERLWNLHGQPSEKR
jgi:hypothetical protein